MDSNSNGDVHEGPNGSQAIGADGGAAGSFAPDTASFDGQVGLEANGLSKDHVSESISDAMPSVKSTDVPQDADAAPEPEKLVAEQDAPQVPDISEPTKEGTPGPEPLTSGPADPAAETPKESPAALTPGPESSESKEATPRPSESYSRIIQSSESHAAISDVLILTSLREIAQSSEANKNKALKGAAEKAIQELRKEQGNEIDPIVIFAAVKLACESKNVPVMNLAIDCIGKLVAYNFFVEGPYGSGTDTLSEAITTTVCECFSQPPSSTTSNAAIQHQALMVRLLSCLLQLVNSATLQVHSTALLTAVRTAYKVFLYSRPGMTQMVALTTFQQIIDNVFGRATAAVATAQGGSNESMDHAEPLKENVAEVSLQQESLASPGHATAEAEASALEAASAAATSAPDEKERTSQDGDDDDNDDAYVSQSPLSEKDILVKDAFLVFRALCKLSIKGLGSDSERDPKSGPMRSKVSCLELILKILRQSLLLFKSPESVVKSGATSASFVSTIREDLLVVMSRNCPLPVPQVYTLALDIFWQVLLNLRSRFKAGLGAVFEGILFTILEMKSASEDHRKAALILIGRITASPQVLMDIYLNYDCDPFGRNLFEKVVTDVSRMSEEPQHEELRRLGLEGLSSILNSLVRWTERSAAFKGDSSNAEHSIEAQDDPLAGGADDSMDMDFVNSSVVAVDDDPSLFENVKQRKNLLQDGIRIFNDKSPKEGIAYLTRLNFVVPEPNDIARFLMFTDGLSKYQIGQYLGSANNLAVMHAFVDLMNFKNVSFVNAIRQFLQAFRLPGEAQQIDRFMLKFADRYMAGNPTAFQSADTAYTLGFSVILLNTDLYNPQVKNPMTLPAFIKNNRGIDHGGDLPEELLTSIYNDIASNEIVLESERDANAPRTESLAIAFGNFGRDIQREVYLQQSENMANRTESLLKASKTHSRKDDTFFTATHTEHVRPMFVIGWTALLAGISFPLQESDDPHIVSTALHAFKLAIKIACLFDLELERNAFVTTLAKYTFLNQMGEMRSKNIEAIKTLLDVALVNGNYLQDSWRDVLVCISKLERFQLIAHAAFASRSSSELDWGSVGAVSSTLDSSAAESKNTYDRAARLRTRTSRPSDQVTMDAQSPQIAVLTDMIFSSSQDLSGTAIMDFVQALSDVSWEEIQVSGLDADQPRVFCLKKLVEVAYYNMHRIRIEWTSLWSIMGAHFNKVTCYDNTKVSFLALDSLRQLSRRFLEKEELSTFSFQKEFLQPFEYCMEHNTNTDSRDMVLSCLQQIIDMHSANLRSGWRTVFGAFQKAAAQTQNEHIISQAFAMVQAIIAKPEQFDLVMRHGAFADLAVCLTRFCNVIKYQRVSLQAIETLRSSTQLMLDSSAKSYTDLDDLHVKYWYPVLFAFYEVVMSGDDVEVRKRALDYLFEILHAHGHSFTPFFWDTVCSKILFPMFSVLRSRSDVSRFATQEDMSMWLSATMIHALKRLVELFTAYFSDLSRLLATLLDILAICVCQDSDTLSRIGTACLQQLIENNVQKFSIENWDQVTTCLIKLFDNTTPTQMFNPRLAKPPIKPDDNTIDEAALEDEHDTFTVDHQRHLFRQILVKCVLHLRLLVTVQDLLRSDPVYSTMPPKHLLLLMSALDKSYHFARKFNLNKELRVALWHVGFMAQLPNILQQESTAASTIVKTLTRMYNDPRDEHVARRQESLEVLLPLDKTILARFTELDPQSQSRSVAAWTPVVIDVLHSLLAFDKMSLRNALRELYPMVLKLMDHPMDDQVRESVRDFLFSVGGTFLY